jgi:predicted transcriptional regulator
MRYRSRTDIVASILEAANGGVTKTKMMYHAYLSYEQLKDYLTILMANGLLEYAKEEARYKTTPKGMIFLKAYNQLAQVAVLT